MGSESEDGGACRPKRRRTLVSLQYPKHVCNPEDLLDFIELPAFTRRWAQLGLDDEDDLSAIQLAIMAHPKGAPVISGTGGLRKTRFAPERWNTGLSGAARVLYACIEDFGIVLLCLAYSKDEIDDISPAVKKCIKTSINEVRRELERKKRL